MTKTELTDMEVEAAVTALQVHHRALRRKRGRLDGAAAEAAQTDQEIADTFGAMVKMQSEQASRDALRKAS